MDPARGRHAQPDASGATPPVQASARDVVRTYGTGETEVRALDGVSVDFAKARLTAIMGPSGSGKSTLMHCMAGLDTPTSGTVTVDGVEISSMSQRALTRLRRTRIGFVFQAYNLVPTLTAEENITLPLDIARVPVDRAWFDAVVDAVGMRARLDHRPGALSGGEQQRVACARALVSRPSVVFADEPTGNLDSKSSREVLAFLRQSVDELGQTVVMVTHDPRAAAYAHRVLMLGDGRVTADLDNPRREEILAAVGAEDDDEPRPRTGRYAAVPAPAVGPPPAPAAAPAADTDGGRAARARRARQPDDAGPS